ncbi:MAG: hypothetical protein M3O30_16925 [Planctomycetota bacterium]|nr:hypothetical protein [Planctomycetota bacterium]
MFSTHFFADNADGFQHVWNLWWVRRSLLVLHQSPWFTTDLHFPYGCSLLGHPLDLTDGILGVAFQCAFSLVQAFNLIVIFAFVSSGIAAFWLCNIFTGNYWASIVGGFVFTFCNYHFSHAQGHLELISLEWIPLFAILWFRQWERGSMPAAIGAAGFLTLAFYDSYYYFIYCILLGFIIAAWTMLSPARRQAVAWNRRLTCLGVFVLLLLVTTGPMLLTVIRFNRVDPLLGNHLPAEYSMDLTTPFVWGCHWRFGALTASFWKSLPGNINENSVYVGNTVLALIVYAWFARRRLGASAIALWISVFAVFGVLALGPSLHIGGHEFSHVWLPYRLLVFLVPPMRLSGAPVRMEIMMQLAAAVLTAFAFKGLLEQRQARSRWIAGAALLLIVMEFQPTPVPATPADPPPFVSALAQTTGPGAVIDIASSRGQSMYYATIYQRPVAFGYFARTPTSVFEKDKALLQQIQTMNLATLRNDGFRFLVVRQPYANMPGRPIFEDNSVGVFDLATQTSSKR